MGHGTFFEGEVYLDCVGLRWCVGVLCESSKPALYEFIHLSTFILGEYPVGVDD